MGDYYCYDEGHFSLYKGVEAVPRSFRLFPTTHWPLVFGAAQEDDDRRRQWLGRLLERYLPALRAYLAGNPQVRDSQVDDLLQGFVLKKVLQGELLVRADPAKCRKFRNYLLTALNRHVFDELRRERPCDPLSPANEPVDPHDGPEDAFHRSWALRTIETALERMRTECEALDRLRFWKVFERRVVFPKLDGAEPPSYHELLEELGFRSKAEAQNALATAKRHFVRKLREVVAEYAPKEGIGPEIADLRELLSGGA